MEILVQLSTSQSKECQSCQQFINHISSSHRASFFPLSGQSLSRISNRSESREGKCWMMLQAVAFHATTPGFTSLFLERNMKNYSLFGCRKDGHPHMSCTLSTWLLCIYSLNHSWTPERTSTEMENGKWSLSWRMSLWMGGGPGAELGAQGTLSHSVAAAHHQPWYSQEDKVLLWSFKYNSSHFLIKWFFSELLGTSYSRNLEEGHLLLMNF